MSYRFHFGNALFLLVKSPPWQAPSHRGPGLYPLRRLGICARCTANFQRANPVYGFPLGGYFGKSGFDLCIGARGLAPPLQASVVLPCHRSILMFAQGGVEVQNGVLGSVGKSILASRIGSEHMIPALPRIKVAAEPPRVTPRSLFLSAARLPWVFIASFLYGHIAHVGTDVQNSDF